MLLNCSSYSTYFLHGDNRYNQIEIQFYNFVFVFRNLSPDLSNDLPTVTYDGGFQNVAFYDAYTPPKDHFQMEQKM